MNDENTVRTHMEESEAAGPVSRETNADAFEIRRVPDSEISSTTMVDGQSPLLASDECQRLRSRWEALQVGFVDDPKNAVDQARELVSEAVRELTQRLTDTERQLQQNQRPSQEASTEEQRVIFKRYRSFFQKLLAV